MELRKATCGDPGVRQIHLILSGVFPMYGGMSPTDIPQDPAERRVWILYRLRVAGYTLGSLAREIGVSRRTPHTALVRPYPKMERAIATAVGLEPQQLWPERYTADGKPNRRHGRPPQKSHTHDCTIITPRRQVANGKQRRAS